MQEFFDRLPEETRSRLNRLVDLFLAENAVTNLSALRTKETCFPGNVLDSLAFLEFWKNRNAHVSLLDVGTGGGFPLLPIAICCPSIRCTGLDAVGKKVKAVERIAAALELKNVRLIQERTEVLGRNKDHRDQYDIVTARAVAPLPVLLEFCAPFLKRGGSLVLWKSLHIDEELTQSKAAEKALHVKAETPIRYTLPGDWGERQLLIYTKTGATDVRYPRAVGEAKQRPITDR